ncbi:diguanylate cyclase [Halarcobacter sp.]|uniref:GGDEF domain-containing response regulator n=1 Tax=Halarcobacter sp. TaxID=2321133 RepID=UPI0029F5A203|nr:diguanylate cyclase [Halarcobacter sp.]
MKKLNKNILESATVLYVEDEDLIREEMYYFLNRYVKKLYVAKNGEEGLKLFHEINPDIIITDIQMPVMNGIEMLKEINNKNIPVIITTAYSDIDFFLDAIELKIDKFIIKPIDLSEIITSIQDLVGASRLKKKLSENDRLLEIIDENVLISITDKDGIIIDVSSSFCEFVGYTKEELLGNTHKILRHEDNSSDFYKNMWETIRKGEVFQAEIRNRKKSKEICWANLTITPLFQDGEIVNYIAIRQDTTNKKKLEDIAIHDDMTGLYNRRYLNEVIEKEIRRIKREESILSLVTIDVDYFKKYNDTYGHPEGDKVLTEVAKILKEHAQRATDYIFRMGGEEFGIIFSDLSIEKSLDFVKDIVKAVEDLKIEHISNETGNYITISAGLIVQSAANLDSFKEMYKLSDEALYKAKENGKNQVVLSDKSQ